ncbi:MAG: hypothetical protein BGO12_23465 [Verrucomicrobia bacterium 61-8]|nr:MAG: hypothetical protein BGO12_23465 [Verrucomicrobia bacterium 61-8]
MPMQILLQVFQSIEKRTVGVTGVGGRLITMGQFPQPSECLSGIIMLMNHAGNRSVEGKHCFTALVHGENCGKENLLFLHHMTVQLLKQASEDVADLQKGRSVRPMNLSDPVGHRMQSWQFAPEEAVMFFNDVGDQFRWR